MPRKAVLLKSLTRGRIRASFNKYNLFNMYKKSQIDFRSKTLYQQKWKAKQETRAYHGEHLTESRWKSIFDPKLKSVAQLDSSLRGGQVAPTPTLMQTFAVLEKRLEMAVFRAMFASSVRQARQFILHGNVFVNGVCVKHPSYILKAGDIFNVKPDKVLQALGAKKPSIEEALSIDKKQITLWNRYVVAARENPREIWNSKLREFRSMSKSSSERQKFVEFISHYNEILDREKREAIAKTTKLSTLEAIIATGSMVADKNAVKEADFTEISHQNKQVARFMAAIYGSLATAGVLSKNTGDAASMAKHVFSFKDDDKLNHSSKVAIRKVFQILNKLLKAQDDAIRHYYDSKKGDLTSCELPYNPEWAKKLPLHPQINVEKLLKEPKAAHKAINFPWQKGLYGHADRSKPYFTPWKPRPFLAPFAVLPHHLEISFKTCNAIYLRDPIARPGQSEVISPFGLPVHERAFMYYVRKGK